MVRRLLKTYIFTCTKTSTLDRYVAVKTFMSHAEDASASTNSVTFFCNILLKFFVLRFYQDEF